MKLTVSTRGDHDPEDEYNLLDNPVVNKTGSKYSKHLGGQQVRASARQQSALLEDAFREGKYEGRVVSRRDLFADYDGDGAGGSDEDLDSAEDYSTGENSEEYSASDISESDAEMETEQEQDQEQEQEEDFEEEMKQLKREEEASLKLIQQQRVSDKTRGEHVRNQMSAWEALLEVEMRLHPLLLAVNRLDVPCKDKNILKELTMIGRQLQQFANQHEWTEQQLCTDGREQLAKWHQQAIATTMTSVNKQGLQSLARDPWTFVDDAWTTDRERLLKKARPTDNTYDDSDFYRHLLKEWTQFRSTDGVAFLATHQNNKHRPTVGRVSKGRRLCHDVHPKLLAYMMPVVRADRQWSDEKVDDLIRSLFR